MYLGDFEVDGIQYWHPRNTASVYARQIIQILDVDERLCPMVVHNNSPKAGLMDSEVDEKWVKEYWE